MHQENIKYKCTIIVPLYNDISNLKVMCEHFKLFFFKYDLSLSVNVLFIDGGSTDGTLSVLQNLELANASYISKKDKGIYDAMNNGVSIASSEYVYFMGADDIILPGFVDVLDESRGEDIIYGNVQLTSNNSIYDVKITALSLIFHNVCHQAIIYNRNILLTNPYTLDYSLLSDWALNIKLSSKCKVKYVNSTVAIYNDVTGVSSTSRDNIFYIEKHAIFTRYHGVIYGILSFVLSKVTKVLKKINAVL
jgi:glycosyltransferase involved in cell wall biosynthesis